MDSRGDLHIQDLLCNLELLNDLGRYDQVIVDDGRVGSISHCILVGNYHHGLTTTVFIKESIQFGTILLGGHIRHVLHRHRHGRPIFRWCLPARLAGREGITLRHGPGSRTRGEISIGYRLELSSVVWEFGCVRGLVAQCLHIGLLVEHGVHGTLQRTQVLHGIER